MIVAPLTGKSLQAVRLSTATLNVFEGSVRSGKTIASLIAWIAFVQSGPPGALLMAGRTERTVKRNLIDVLTDMLGKERCHFSMGSGELTILGRRIYVVGANDERSQEKIRGLTLAGAYVDEASTVPESFWTMLRSRLSVEGARLYATTNPDSPRCWLKIDWLDRASLHLTGPGEVVESESGISLHRFSFRLPDNPNLPPGYFEQVSKDYVGLWYRRFILGDWVAAQGAIFDMWDERRHVVTETPAIARWLAAGVDYGTVNDFVAVMLGLGVDGCLYITSEYRHASRTAHRSMTDAEYDTAVRAWITAQGVHPEWVVIDPSAASFIEQAHRGGGLHIAPADNTVIDGIRTMASLLATDRLKIHASCTGLIEEISGYAWDPKASDRGEDKPIKTADHGVDATRYAIRTTEALWRPYVPLAATAA